MKKLGKNHDQLVICWKEGMEGRKMCRLHVNTTQIMVMNHSFRSPHLMKKVLFQLL